MSTEENKAVPRRVYEEVLNDKNLDLVDELFAPGYVNHDPTSPEEMRGTESLKQFFGAYLAAFPDLRFVVEDQVAEGDKVASRWTSRGTNQGELMGAPPTGKRVEFTGVTISRISEGKIAEDWTSYDALGMMRQLGLIPAPDQAAGS